MNFAESTRHLYSLGRELAAPSHARTMKFDLANISALAARMHHPERRFRSVHIAGTNGKGSTAAMIESILGAAGYRTGLFTSPHLERINERIRVAGQEVADEDFAASFTRLHALIEEMLASGALAAHPTFFECLTAIAFDVFARSRVEFAVLEVGMGGRLDATNVVTAEVSVITHIGFDHEAFLGHSIAQIASEKAGIIKRGIPVISSVTDPSAGEVIRRRAAELSAPLVETDCAYRIESLEPAARRSRIRVSELRGGFTAELEIPLPGRHQVRNALAAIATVRLLAEKGAHINSNHVREGIANVRWPGRLEQIAERPEVFLDGAHNPAGARELASFFEEHFSGRKILLVFGAVRDKSVEEIAEILFPRAAEVFITAPKNSRAISAEALAEMTRGLARTLHVIAEPCEALGRAISAAGPEGIVVAAGSLYLIGDLRRWWNAQMVLPSSVWL